MHEEHTIVHKIVFFILLIGNFSLLFIIFSRLRSLAGKILMFFSSDLAMTLNLIRQ